jgi:hypothetical protein
VAVLNQAGEKTNTQLDKEGAGSVGSVLYQPLACRRVDAQLIYQLTLHT